ncbi:voltage-gated potassium channel [Inquilinus ginsengisoli]
MGWRTQVATALDGRHPGLGHRVELGLHALILYSALSMGIETLPGLPGWAATVLAVSESVVVAVFTAEYVLRLATTPAPGAYARGFFGVVDLLAIAPFYLGLVFAGIGIDLRAVRALRLLRLVRLLKLARYNSAIDRLTSAWRAVKEEIVVFGAAAVIVLYVCALVIYQFEHDAQPEAFASVFDAMWWAAVTLTTVGYGDVYPVTAIGRIFTVLMLFVALGIIAIPTGLVASALGAIRAKEAAVAAAAEDREAAHPRATSRD